MLMSCTDVCFFPPCVRPHRLRRGTRRARELKELKDDRRSNARVSFYRYVVSRSLLTRLPFLANPCEKREREREKERSRDRIDSIVVVTCSPGGTLIAANEEDLPDVSTKWYEYCLPGISEKRSDRLAR